MTMQTVFVDARFTVDNLEGVVTRTPIKLLLTMLVPVYVLDETSNGDDFRFEVAIQSAAFPIFRARPTLLDWTIID
jgi:hypothetical protein